jgi:catechol 2,3-dioxygenase-like lactoylglutathione lyase family enzyme
MPPISMRQSASMVKSWASRSSSRSRAGTYSIVAVPTHGAKGPGHLCFRAPGGTIDDWRRHLEAAGVEIEMDFEWPQGGRSIYFRDPAGNSLEFAEPRIWRLD